MRSGGFTAGHFHEHPVGDLLFRQGDNWTKAFLQSKGLLENTLRLGASPPQAASPAVSGHDAAHQDGSRHEWLAGREAMDLTVTMDDATNEIYSALLTAEGGNGTTFQARVKVR